jgi:hypothetical protein
MNFGSMKKLANEYPNDACATNNRMKFLVKSGGGLLRSTISDISAPFAAGCAVGESLEIC